MLRAQYIRLGYFGLSVFGSDIVEINSIVGRGNIIENYR
jgi:hypothetical protein